MHSTLEIVRNIWILLQVSRNLERTFGLHCHDQTPIELTSSDVRSASPAPYGTGPKVRELERAGINKMLNVSVIELAKSEWASLIVLAAKQNSVLRFCIDHRNLKHVTVSDFYQFRRLGVYLVSIGKARKCLRWDTNSGYWPAKADEWGKKKLAFSH